jgi:hypothetical protein
VTQSWAVYYCYGYSDDTDCGLLWFQTKKEAVAYIAGLNEEGRESAQLIRGESVKVPKLPPIPPKKPWRPTTEMDKLIQSTMKRLGKEKYVDIADDLRRHESVRRLLGKRISYNQEAL